MILVTTGRPTVSVPVLSNTIASARPACSRWDPPLIRMPRRAPLPIAALIAVGVDRPTAQGHATNSMVIARRTSPVITRVTAETMNEVGTKRREKFSPTVWMGARSCWASSTRADDAPDRGLVADGPGPYHQAAAHHYRPGVHVGADRDADGQILAGDRRLVDDRLAVDDLAVHRYRDVVVNDHVVADLHAVDGHLNLGPGAVGQPDPCRVLAAAQQLRDGPPGPAQREILQVFADVEQPQHGERHHVLAQHQARHRRRRHQGIGAGAAGAQRAQRAAQEGVAGEDGDAGGQYPAASRRAAGAGRRRSGARRASPVPHRR